MKWREEEGGPVLRGAMTGRLLARVNHTGSLWRGTVWTAIDGSSSSTELTLKDAMQFCEEFLKHGRC